MWLLTPWATVLFFHASGRCHKPALMTYVRDVGEDQMSYDINF